MQDFNPEDFDFMTDEEIDSLFGIDTILELLRQIPKEFYSILDVRRYKEVMKAITDIGEIVARSDPHASIEIEYDYLTSTSLFVHITTNYFVVKDIEKFCGAISVANVIEITPINGECFDVSISFEEVKQIIK